KGELEGFPEDELHRFFRGSSGHFTLPSPERGVVIEPIGEPNLRALARFAAAHAVTPGTVYHALWALVQARYLETDDVVFGAVMSGRWGDTEGIDALVGPTIGVAPLRVRVGGDLPLSRFLRELQDRLAALQRYAHVPWDRIATEVWPKRRSLPTW